MSGTLDRDVRLSPDQIHYLTRCVKDRRKVLGRSIARADAAHVAGGKIQRGTYDRHIKEFAELGHVADALEAARKQIQHKIRASLGLNEGGS